MSTIENDAPVPDDYGDFDVEMLAERRNRRLPAARAALAVGVIAAAAFIGGVEIQKAEGGSPATTGSAAAGAANAASRGARGGFGATAAGGGGATIGTVSAIKDGTLYVTDANRNTVKVSTSASSRVTKTTSSTVKLSSVRPGATVVVQGEKQANGTIAATSISLGSGAIGGARGVAGTSGAPTGFGG